MANLQHDMDTLRKGTSSIRLTTTLPSEALVTLLHQPGVYIFVDSRPFRKWKSFLESQTSRKRPHILDFRALSFSQNTLYRQHILFSY
mmetsp:Transcript_11732/g.37351  ORF Transcript_11732/g.37351 Transcript_11732/m.37351 type:complete len:88 (-) Transcript_11732:1782-2045(-)